MNCLEFRRRVGAEPSVSDADLEGHRRECPACSRYQDELRAMDALLARALAVDAARIRRPDPAVQAARATRSRPRWLALAASILISVSAGLRSGSARRAPLAREVIGHVAHEPGR
jgi:hypothetical protein